MNVQALLKQAQKMQSDLKKIEQELEMRTYVEENDLVCVECDGKYHITTIKIKSKNLEDLDMLQDMIAVIVNKVIEKAKTEHEQELAKITGGVKMPGAF